VQGFQFSFSATSPPEPYVPARDFAVTVLDFWLYIRTPLRRKLHISFHCRRKPSALCGYPAFTASLFPSFLFPCRKRNKKTQTVENTAPPFDPPWL